MSHNAIGLVKANGEVDEYGSTGSGGFVTSEVVDGNYTITTDSSGNISSIVFTDYPMTYTRTTTFVKTSTSEIIVELKVLTGASVGTQKTITKTGNSVTVRTTIVPVSNS